MLHQDNATLQWPSRPKTPIITVLTEEGNLLVRHYKYKGGSMLIITSEKVVDVPIVRFHSACMFGESMHAKDCDCGVQLLAAQKKICSEGGIITYAWEEGRGIGIANKIRALHLEQNKNINTAEAFESLGFVPEPRKFDNHVAALKSAFNGKKVRLISANKTKINALKAAGFDVIERVKLKLSLTTQQKQYVGKKKKFLGHL